MKVITNRIYKNYFLLLLSLLAIELIFRALGEGYYFDWALLRIFIGINIIAAFLSLLLSFIPKFIEKIVIVILTFFSSLYACIQIGFINFIGAYISFASSNQLDNVLDVIKDYLHSLKIAYFLVFIPFIMLCLYYLILDKKTNKKETSFNYNSGRILLLMGVTIGIVFYQESLSISFMQNPIQLRSNKALFNNPDLPNISINQFGIIVYGGLDLKQAIFPAKEEVIEYKPKDEVEAETDFSRLFDNSLWQDLIAKERNKNYNLLNNYFINQRITPRNEYTGIFEGKNLIVILMESVNNIALNKEYYPTIWKLYTEGWAWDNAYSPRNGCPTGNNELSGLVSLYAIPNTCAANTYKNNIYPESIFNLFNKEGYLSTSYHNYDSSFYSRQTYHPNMGSAKYYDVRALGLKRGDYGIWNSDIDLIEKSLPHFINEEKFMSWMITVTTHGPYWSSEYGNMYLNDFKNYTPSTDSARYMSKLKILDLALEKLLLELTNSGRLNDTVIMLYADHYPYYLSKPNISKMLGYDVSERREVDRTPFIIYNPEVTPQKFNEYTTFINILPTLANLFNLDYDPRLYMGEDLMDDNYSGIAVFSDGSWQSNIAYYDSKTASLDYIGDKKYSAKEIIEINNRISNKIKMSNIAIAQDYFNYLGKNLGSWPKTIN